MNIPGTPDTGRSIGEGAANLDPFSSPPPEAAMDPDGGKGLSNVFLDDREKEVYYRKMVEDRAKKLQGQVDRYHGRVGAKLAKYKKRIEEFTRREKELQEENYKLRELLNHGKDNTAGFALELKQKQMARKTQVERRQLERNIMRQELVEDVGQLEQIGQIDEMTEEVDEKGIKRGTCFQTRRAIRSCLHSVTPFKSDIEFISIRYGSGMATYFEFYRFMFVNTIAFVLGWTIVFVSQLVLFGMQNSSDFYSFQGFYPIWFYYSALVVPKAMYATSIALTMVYLAFSSLSRLATEHKKLLESSDSEKVPTRYSSVALNIWDYRTVNQTEVNNALHVTAQHLNLLIAEDDLQASIANRSKYERIKLSVRKGIGLTLNILLIIASSLIVIGVNYYQQDISRLFPGSFGELIAPLVLSLVKASFPLATIWITEFEKYDDAGVLLQQQTIRLFAGKQTFVLALAAVSFNSVQTNQDYDKEIFTCQEDQIGATLFNSAMIEFFTTKISEVGTYYATEMLRTQRCCCGQKKPIFRASAGVVDLIYFQSLVWISIPLFPFGGVLSTLFLYFNFKFEKFTLLHLRRAPRATKNDGIVFVAFLILSVLCMIAVFGWFLRCRWKCEDLGAFAAKTPYETMEEKLEQWGVGFLFWASPYIAIATTTLITYILKTNEVGVQESKFKEFHTSSVKEMEKIKKILRSQALALEVLHKRQQKTKVPKNDMKMA